MAADVRDGAIADAEEPPGAGEDPGLETLRWQAETGDWMVVGMNADGSPGLTVRAAAGTALVGIWALGEAVSTVKLVSIGLTLAGVIGLNLAGVTP